MRKIQKSNSRTNVLPLKIFGLGGILASYFCISALLLILLKAKTEGITKGTIWDRFIFIVKL